MTSDDGEDEARHYHGHRERLRARLLDAGPAALADYELLELVLFRAIPRVDVKPLAKELIDRFGSFAEAIAAEPQRLAEVEGMRAGAIKEFKIVEAAAHRFAKGAARKRLAMGSWNEVIDYCRTTMAFENREIFRVLFLDKKNGLIKDEVQRLRHHRPHAGLSARSGPARAGAVGDGDRARPQSPFRRPHTLGAGRQNDARADGDRQASRRHGA